MAKNQTTDVNEIILETARVQLATLNAGISFWTGWLENASQYAQQVSDALAEISSSKSDPGKITSQITDAGKTFLRQTTDLSSRAVDQFNNDLKGVARKQKRSRSAKAKP